MINHLNEIDPPPIREEMRQKNQNEMVDGEMVVSGGSSLMVEVPILGDEKNEMVDHETDMKQSQDQSQDQYDNLDEITPIKKQKKKKKKKKKNMKSSSENERDDQILLHHLEHHKTVFNERERERSINLLTISYDQLSVSQSTISFRRKCQLGPHPPMRW